MSVFVLEVKSRKLDKLQTLITQQAKHFMHKIDNSEGIYTGKPLCG